MRSINDIQESKQQVPEALPVVPLSSTSSGSSSLKYSPRPAGLHPAGSAAAPGDQDAARGGCWAEGVRRAARAWVRGPAAHPLLGSDAPSRAHQGAVWLQTWRIKLKDKEDRGEAEEKSEGAAPVWFPKAGPGPRRLLHSPRWAPRARRRRWASAGRLRSRGTAGTGGDRKAL